MTKTMKMTRVELDSELLARTEEHFPPAMHGKRAGAQRVRVLLNYADEMLKEDGEAFRKWLIGQARAT